MKLYTLVLFLFGLTSIASARQSQQQFPLANNVLEIKSSSIPRNYIDGNRAGLSISFYPNLKVKRKTEYPEIAKAKSLVDNNITNYFNSGYMEKRLFEANSDGTVSVYDGNGHIREIIDNGDAEQVEEGNYVGGYKDGFWTGFYTHRKESFKETYVDCKMIGGETIKDGKKYSYSIIVARPEFIGGYDASNAYFDKNLKYPPSAKAQSISGTVQTSFIIDVDGKISDLRIEKSIEPYIDLEAARLIYNVPRWQPAKMRGVPFKTRFYQSVNFWL